MVHAFVHRSSPSNRVFLRAFSSFDEMTNERWIKLFDSRSLYRLLYALQIIDDIMLRREKAVDQTAVARQRWCEVRILCTYVFLHQCIIVME
jgi:hypothetical protein